MSERLEPLPQPAPTLPLTPEDFGALHAASRAAASAGLHAVHKEAVLLLRAASAAVEAQVVRATQHAAATVWRPTGVARPTYHGASNPTLTPAVP